MGLFGEQIADGAIQEAKLDAASQSKLNAAFFSPGTGLDAGIGRGTALAPLAGGDHALAHGPGCVADAPNSGSFGENNLVGTNAKSSLVWGEGNELPDLVGVNGQANLVVGRFNQHEGDFGGATVGTFNYNHGYNNVIFGSDCTSGSAAGQFQCSETLSVGYYNQCHVGFALLIGTNDLRRQDPTPPASGEVISVGYGNVGVGADHSLILGHFNVATAARTITQGVRVHAFRTNQRAFGATPRFGGSSGQPLGQMQWNFLPHQDTTPDATPKLIGESIAIEADKAYIMEVEAICINNVDDDQVASFDSGKFTVYRKPGAVPVIVGGGFALSPVSNTGAPADTYAAAVALAATPSAFGPDSPGVEFTTTTIIRPSVAGVGEDWKTDGIKVGDYITIASAEDGANDVTEEVTGVSDHLGPKLAGRAEFTTDTIIRAGAGTSWINDGVVNGDYIWISGADEAGNNGPFGPVTNVTDEVLTIAGAGFTVDSLDFGVTFQRTFDSILTLAGASFTPNADDTTATFTKVNDAIDILGTGDGSDECRWGVTWKFSEVLRG